jgi:MoxR-like ATPase
MNNIILADEINRTSPKTQASLLEAMEEKQVTVDGVSYPLARPFMVIATQNPVIIWVPIIFPKLSWTAL